LDANRGSKTVSDRIGERSGQAAVGQRRLYSDTGHRRRDFLIDRMTGSGRRLSAAWRRSAAAELHTAVIEEISAT
jgi:hypothetical protein